MTDESVTHRSTRSTEIMSISSVTNSIAPSTSQSVEKCVGRLGNLGHRCWEIKDNLRDTYYSEIRPAILARLRHRIGSVSSQSSVIIVAYMIGRRASTAAPTVLFVSEDPKCREEARKVVKESRLLSPYQGWKSAQASRDPTWRGNLQQLASGSCTGDSERFTSLITNVLYNPVKPIRSTGMSLYLEVNSGIRTFTANFIRIDGKPMFLGPAHTFFGNSDVPTSVLVDPDDEFEIDTDDDTNTIWGDDGPTKFSVVELDSKADQSSDTSDDSDESIEHGECDAYSQSSFNSHDDQVALGYMSRSTPSDVPNVDFGGSLRTPSLSSLAPFGVLSQWSTDKDWALIEIQDSNDPFISAFCAANHHDLSTLKTTRPRSTGSAVVTRTASSGTLLGTVSGTISDMRVPYGDSFEEVFSIQLDGFLTDGDCGSIVVDAQTGELYGHIVAGCRATGFAYVIPASHTLADLSGQILGALRTQDICESSGSGLVLSENPVTKFEERSSISQIPVRSGTLQHGSQLDAVTRNSWCSSSQSLEIQHPKSDIGKSILSSLTSTLPSAHKSKGPQDSWLSSQNNWMAGMSGMFREPFHLPPEKYEHSGWLFPENVNLFESKSTAPCTQQSRCLFDTQPDEATTLRRPEQLSEILPIQCLSFVPYVIPLVLENVIKSPTDKGAEVLRLAVREYFVGEISIRAHTSVEGFPIFRLILNLPFLSLEEAEDEKSGVRPRVDSHNKKIWEPFPFLHLQNEEDDVSQRFVIYETRSAVVLSGRSNSDWFGYALGNIGAVDTSTSNDDGDDAAGDETDELNHFFSQNEPEPKDGFLATGGHEPVLDPKKPIWNPWIYFLRAVEIRLIIMTQASEHLVRKIDAGCQDWIPDNTSTQEALDRTIRMTKVFSRLRKHFAQSLRAWDRFRSTGDVMYFAGLGTHPIAREALSRITKSFEKISDLEHRVGLQETDCTASSMILKMRITLNANILMRENNQRHLRSVSRTLKDLEVGQRAGQYSEEAAARALKSMVEAEGMSRSTHVNVQLFLITTAIVLVLQYYCSERVLLALH